MPAAAIGEIDAGIESAEFRDAFDHHAGDRSLGHESRNQGDGEHRGENQNAGIGAEDEQWYEEDDVQAEAGDDPRPAPAEGEV